MNGYCVPTRCYTVSDRRVFLCCLVLTIIREEMVLGPCCLKLAPGCCRGARQCNSSWTGRPCIAWPHNFSVASHKKRGFCTSAAMRQQIACVRVRWGGAA